MRSMRKSFNFASLSARDLSPSTGWNGHQNKWKHTLSRSQQVLISFRQVLFNMCHIVSHCVTMLRPVLPSSLQVLLHFAAVTWWSWWVEWNVSSTKAVDGSRALSFVIVSDVLIRTVAAVANSITNSGGVDLRSWKSERFECETWAEKINWDVSSHSPSELIMAVQCCV
jgi:hypothetical protein